MNGKKLFPLALTLSALVLQAGPPLICWPIDIGDFKSLPWGAARPWGSHKAGQDTGNVAHASWDAVKSDYDVGQLTEHVTALLAPQTPVLLRMETLRRAAIYAQKDQHIAFELTSRLTARALDAEAKGKPDALAWFDAGYFAECYKQAGMMDRGHRPVTWLNGYEWISRALRLRVADAEMQFAAALITVYDHATRAKHPNHEEHLRKAVAGAAEGSPLARNLVLHFSDRGTTLAALRAKL